MDGNCTSKDIKRIEDCLSDGGDRHGFFERSVLDGGKPQESSCLISSLEMVNTVAY